MPPRGWRKYGEVEVTYFDDEAAWKEARAQGRENRARSKAIKGKEPDLRHLVDIAALMIDQGISANAAAARIANEVRPIDPRGRLAGRAKQARVQHAKHKDLYRKFQKAPEFFRRLALAPENDPAEAAMREMDELYEAGVREAELRKAELGE